MIDFKKFIGATAIEKWGGEKPTYKKRVGYKHYLRFNKIFFNNLKKSSQLNKLFKRRRSLRNFRGKPISLDKIGILLSAGCGKVLMDKNYKDYLRSYPSAGARFPLEVYAVSINKRNGISKGIYHYNILLDCLERLSKYADNKQIKKIFKQIFIKNVSFFLVITAYPNRTIEKYGIRGIRYIFMEAGHMAQNFYLVSTEQNIKCCAIGAFLDKKLAQLLFLDEDKEFPLYVLAIGK